MAENTTLGSVAKGIGNFKLKSLIPFAAGVVLGYLLHEYFHDNLTIDQIKELIDYVANTWQKFK